MPRDNNNLEQSRLAKLEPLSLNETVQTEIELNEAKAIEIENLERQWKQQRDAIAHKPVQEVSYDIGGVSVRSIQQEYTEKRAQHDRKQDEIERRFTDLTAAVREVGTTAMGEFNLTNNPEQEKKQEQQETHVRETTITVSGPAKEAEHIMTQANHEFQRQMEPPERGRSR